MTHEILVAIIVSILMLVYGCSGRRFEFEPNLSASDADIDSDAADSGDEYVPEMGTYGGGENKPANPPCGCPPGTTPRPR